MISRNKGVLAGSTVFWLLFCVMFFTSPLAVMAQQMGTPTNVGAVEEIANKVLGFLTGGIAKIITTIALVGLGFGLIMNRDNQEAKKKFITWLVAVAILRGAQEIVNVFGFA